MHYVTMASGACFLVLAFVFRHFRLRREKRQEMEQAHTEALQEDRQREWYAQESAKIDRTMAETRQMMAELYERFRREQLLREWHARGGWVHGAPPPEVWELVPGWKLPADKPREDN